MREREAMRHEVRKTEAVRGPDSLGKNERRTLEQGDGRGAQTDKGEKKTSL